ncbi:hypothetical protein N9933_02025 [bacterium]|nr:hypothetical protein [bacterium]
MFPPLLFQNRQFKTPTLKWVGVLILPIFLWSCSNLYKAKQKPGCKEVFDLFKNEWSYDESKKIYIWSMGPMSTGGDMMVKENKECFLGLEKTIIKKIMGVPTSSRGDTFWVYNYGPLAHQHMHYQFFLVFNKENQLKKMSQSYGETIINKSY